MWLYSFRWEGIWGFPIPFVRFPCQAYKLNFDCQPRCSYHALWQLSSALSLCHHQHTITSALFLAARQSYGYIWSNTCANSLIARKISLVSLSEMGREQYWFGDVVLFQFWQSCFVLPSSPHPSTPHPQVIFLPAHCLHSALTNLWCQSGSHSECEKHVACEKGGLWHTNVALQLQIQVWPAKIVSETRRRKRAGLWFERERFAYWATEKQKLWCWGRLLWPHE